MARLILIAHTPLASALAAVAAHTFPDCAASVTAFDVTPDLTPDQVQARGLELLSSFGEAETLVLTDVFGATPSNGAQRLADGARVRVVTGVNVPMLWRALSYLNEPIESVAARALAGATQGVMQIGASRPQQQSRAGAAEDAEDYRHHQQ